MDIRKETGEKEPFNKRKLCISLKKAGAPAGLAEEVCERVAGELPPGATTSRIFRTALRYLTKENPAAAARYSVKRGIAELGPAGFLFEKFVETILRAKGYATRRNVFMRGKCIRHEIDILAKKDSEHVLVEAKYHNTPSLKTHVDVVMYADARLVDIEKERRTKERREVPHIMWLFTNTRFSGQAVRYARCRRIRLTGWNYPKGEGLEDLVHRHGLYPVTALPSVDRAAREMFAKHNMMLVQDIVPYTAEDLEKRFGVPRGRSRRIAREAHALIEDRIR